MKLSYPPGATPLGPNEVDGLLPSSISTQAELNEFEQTNILSAERWALRGRKKVLSEEFVRSLHKRMFGEVWKWAGTYRRNNKNVGVEWHQVPGDVAKLCADAMHWVEHQTYGWDELGARFHRAAQGPRTAALHLEQNELGSSWCGPRALHPSAALGGRKKRRATHRVHQVVRGSAQDGMVRLRSP